MVNHEIEIVGVFLLSARAFAADPTDAHCSSGETALTFRPLPIAFHIHIQLYGNRSAADRNTPENVWRPLAN